ncbi:MAG: methionine synthase [Desulfobacteraceae bacterium]|nr:MAG: methionine synthase [Desulfobacteraceae bacterium]
MLEKLADALTNMRENEAIETAKNLLNEGKDPSEILNSCMSAMERVGKRFEKGLYFLPELMMAGEIFKQISAIVKPKLKKDYVSKRNGKILMGTVKGDIHDIGKDIVTFLLDVNGFEVRDIGIDVPPSKFLEEIRMFKPQVVGMSGLLTLAFDSMKVTIQEIENAGLRQGLKIMIGGGQVNENTRRYANADAFGKDAMEAVTLSKKWILGE